MPELPEVETIRRGLVQTLGLKEDTDFTALPQIQAWHFSRKDLRFPLPIEGFRALVGAHLLSLERRSKYLIFYCCPNLEGCHSLPQSRKILLHDLDYWGPKLQICRIVVHLGMTGVLRSYPSDPPLANPPIMDKHDHLWLKFRLAGKTTHSCYLKYHDPRRFGFWELFHWGEPFPRKLGAEPLQHYRADFTLATDSKQEEWSPDYLHQSSHKVQRALKPWLLDGKVVCGVGNIYCSEALWLAQLAPDKAAKELSLEQAASLHLAINQVIAAAIKAGGTTLRDYRNAQGQPGYFQQELHVYGREGQPCSRCGHKIIRLVQSQRASFYCPTCQK